MHRLEPFSIMTYKGMLLGRDQAKTVREAVIERLERATEFSILPLDFNDVAFLDFSSADELIAKVIARTSIGDLKDRYIVLMNANEVVKENIQAALELQQMACVHIPSDHKEEELLGKVSAELRETYFMARRTGRISARDVVNAGCKSISAASNRLSKLFQLGLLARGESVAVESGGRQHIYRPVC